MCHERVAQRGSYHADALVEFAHKECAIAHTLATLRSGCYGHLSISMVAFAFSVWVDLFEKFHEVSRTYEEWDLDEIFSMFVVLSFAGLIFAVRRVKDPLH